MRQKTGEQSPAPTKTNKVPAGMGDSEDMMHFIIKNIPSAVAVLDMNLRFLAVSDRYLSEYNVKQKNILGKFHHDIFPKTPECVKEAQQRCLKGSVERFENDTFTKPDGTVVHVSWECRPWFKLKGKTGGIISFSEVLSNNKKVAYELLKSEENFRSIFENNSAAIAIMEPDTTISMVNEAYCKISGYTKKEIVGTSWKEQVPPGDLERLLEYNRRRLINQNDAPSHYEFSFYKKNREIRYGLMSISVIESSRKTVTSFIDITERKLADEKLDQRNRELQFLTSTAFSLTELSPLECVPDFLIKQLQKLTASRFILYAEYNPINSTLANRHVETSPEILTKIGKIAGNKLLHYEINVDSEDYSMITREVVRLRDSLDHIIPGVISKKVEKAIKTATGIDKYYGISYVIAGELFGISLMGFSDDQPVPDKELLESFANLAAVTLRRINAEDRLKISERTLSNLISNLPGFTYRCSNDKDWTMTFISEGIYSLTGYTNAEFIGNTARPYVSIILPDDRSRIWTIVQEALDERKYYEFEYRIRTLSGEVKYVWERGRGVFGDDDKLLFLEGFVSDISERKLAEEAMKESEEKFRMLTESSPYAVMIFQNDKWVYTNPAGESISGYSARELYTLKYWDFVAREFRKKIIRYGKGLQKGRVISTSYEFKILTKDGMEKWLYLTGSSIMHNGKPAAIIFVVDITRRKQVELSLAESEERYRLFINATEDLVFLKDELLRYMIVNPSNAAFFSKEESEIIGKTDFDLMPKEMAEQCFISDKLAQVSDTISIQEEKVGNEIFETHKFQVPLPGRKPGVGGYIRNVTKRRRAEQLQKVLYTISNAVNVTRDITELVEQIREQLGTLLDTSNFFMAFYDEKTGMLSSPFTADERDTINTWPAEKSATGYVIRHNRSLLATEEDFRKLYATGEIEEVGSPSKVWLGVPLRVKGKVIGAIVVQSYHDDNAYDMEDVEMLEFVSHQISNSIQRKRSEEDLKSALTRAEESDRLKTAFLANLSHEIRTPMNAILGFSNLLENENFTKEERRNFISIIQKSGKQLLTIISDIIDISKIVNNQITISKTRFSINSLLDTLLTSFENQKSAIGKSGLKIIAEKTLENRESTIETDEVRLTQIFNNLIDNALKFTMQGFIKFGYRIEEGKSIFYVQDTGKGIAEEKQEIVFLRFRQEDETQSAVFGGSGLGLSISKGLVELLGGEIWVKSVKNQGSTFFFTLPESVFVSRNSDREIEGTGEGKSDFKGKTILVIVNECKNAEPVRDILSPSGASLIFTKDGAEGVDICRKNPNIDLVLITVRLAGTDGIQVISTIRDANPAIPVIALNDLMHPEDNERCIEAGCNNFMALPVRKETLLPMVNQYLL